MWMGEVEFKVAEGQDNSQLALGNLFLNFRKVDTML